MPRDPEFRCFPDRDEAFRVDVQASIARSRQAIRRGQQLVELVRRDLADRYPAIVIAERDPLAEVGIHVDHWYVYRDGHPA